VLGAEVVDEGEEVGVAERERDEMGACGGDERDADAAAPGIGIDIEGGELAVMGKVGLLRGTCGGEAENFVVGVGGDVAEATGGLACGVAAVADDVVEAIEICKCAVGPDVKIAAGTAVEFGVRVSRGLVEGDDGVGVGRIGVGEIVFLGAVLGAELIEIAGGEDSGVAVLPGANVDARDGERVGRLGGTEEHGKSMAEKEGLRD